MNIRFLRFLAGSIMFFFAISEFALVSHNVYGWVFTVPFFLRAAIGFSGSYLLINVIQKSDEP
jgi:hypothetical protein